MLTPNQLQARENKLTASRVKVLMDGDPEALMQLYKEMLGLAEPKDLSNIWAVRLGEVTEQLNLDWYEYKIEHKVTRRGEVVIGDPDWMAATLDGFDEELNYCIECKHVGGREPVDKIVERYMAQVHWQMLCTYTTACVLSIIMGANEPIYETVPYNDAYAKELMTRAAAFMLCLETLTPPAAAPKFEAPVQQIKRYNMSDNEEWMSLAPRWIQTIGAAQTAKECEKGIKALVPDDASAAFGGGVIVTRNRAGAMSLRRGE